MRYVLMIIAVGFASGCATDVMMVNPRTGGAAICRESLHGLNPWSQKEACVADYITQGWTRSTRD